MEIEAETSTEVPQQIGERQRQGQRKVGPRNRETETDRQTETGEAEIKKLTETSRDTERKTGPEAEGPQTQRHHAGVGDRRRARESNRGGGHRDGAGD